MITQLVNSKILYTSTRDDYYVHVREIKVLSCRVKFQTGVIHDLAL